MSMRRVIADRGERWRTRGASGRTRTRCSVLELNSNSGDVLIDVLGREFAGELGRDYFSAYRRYMRECGVIVQFCLAHLIRDVKFLTTLPDKAEQAYGQRLRDALRSLFAVTHQRETLNASVFAQQLEEVRQQVLATALGDVPTGRHSQNLKKRFERHGAAYFQFVTTPDVEPTKNLAEQAIRFVVIDRRITQGTRSEGGRTGCARIWTVIANLRGPRTIRVRVLTGGGLHAHSQQTQCCPCCPPEEVDQRYRCAAPQGMQGCCEWESPASRPSVQPTSRCTQKTVLAGAEAKDRSTRTG